MSFWKWLGFGGDASDCEKPADTDTVRRIVSKLDGIPREEARYVAAFAYVLGRVAFADRDISEDETAVMYHLVEEYGGLDESRAELVVDIASDQNLVDGGTENFLVTQQLAEFSTREQRELVLHCLFAVAAADDSISNLEDREVRQIASELGFSHREFIEVRSAFNDKREVVKMRSQH